MNIDNQLIETEKVLAYKQSEPCCAIIFYTVVEWEQFVWHHDLIVWNFEISMLILDDATSSIIDAASFTVFSGIKFLSIFLSLKLRRDVVSHRQLWELYK